MIAPAASQEKHLEAVESDTGSVPTALPGLVPSRLKNCKELVVSRDADVQRSAARYATTLEGRVLMVLEIAQIDVKNGMEAEFEAGVAEAIELFRRAKGCSGMELQRSIEKPSRYRLLVQWETLENHTVGFRGSKDFQSWRSQVGHCFEAPPEVEHTKVVVHGF
jgi:heme-degrading monooxygenase HmoA